MSLKHPVKIWSLSKFQRFQLPTHSLYSLYLSLISENGGFFFVFNSGVHPELRSPWPSASSTWCYCHYTPPYYSEKEIHFPTLFFLFFSGFASSPLFHSFLSVLFEFLIWDSNCRISPALCNREWSLSCASRRCSPSRGFCYQNSGPSFCRCESFLSSAFF